MVGNIDPLFVRQVVLDNTDTLCGRQVVVGNFDTLVGKLCQVALTLCVFVRFLIPNASRATQAVKELILQQPPPPAN